MNGEAPVAIPTTFENTRFPSVAEKIKNLVTSREEALAAHELARSRMAERIKSNFTPFKKGQMVWLSVAVTRAGVFADLWNKIGKIPKIFERLDYLRSQWVLCQL
jgi:hypothetical protein